MSLIFEWYVSQCEERWLATGAATREAAIAFGRTEYCGERFSICRARRSRLNFRIRAWEIIEQLVGINEENVDPESCEGVLGNQDATADQESDLEKCVEAAIRLWFERNKFSVEGWVFEEIRDQETILDEREYPPDVRKRFHKLVASMGSNTFEAAQ
ncbi:hypothetical protein [Methylocystis parvus]|uniref:hypothetical protein n=1 Tax=Methylocystis parvus TaxID=134 RepID=UPI003C7478D9